MLEEIAHPRQVALGAPELALRLPRVGLGLAEIRRLNLGQRHAVGDGLADVHEQLANDPGEGREHAHRRILSPNQPARERHKGGRLAPDRLDDQGGQLRRVRGHDDCVPSGCGLRARPPISPADGSPSQERQAQQNEGETMTK